MLILCNSEDNRHKLHLHALIWLLMVSLLGEEKDTSLRGQMEDLLDLTLEMWVHERLEEEVRMVIDHEEMWSAKYVLRLSTVVCLSYESNKWGLFY